MMQVWWCRSPSKEGGLFVCAPTGEEARIVAAGKQNWPLSDWLEWGAEKTTWGVETFAGPHVLFPKEFHKLFGEDVVPGYCCKDEAGAFDSRYCRKE